MIFKTSPYGGRGTRAGGGGGFVLIIVLWVALGLVSIALYFANSMGFELRAADNRVAGLAADQAIEGAVRYVNSVLANQLTNGIMPDVTTYQSEAVPVGDAYFWLIGRDTNQDAQVMQQTKPAFGLIDEASKLNLNTATTNMLEALPGMTPDLADAIVNWRNGKDAALSQSYNLLQPSYLCKSTNFESIAELRLVYGMTMDILYGEDANLNGVLDPNENDGTASLPNDNQDGQLDPGILEYVTVYSREPNTGRTNVSNRAQLDALLQRQFGARRAGEIVRFLPPVANYNSLMEFYIRSRMTADEFGQIERSITTTTGNYRTGLINVNTANETVLACIPGIGTTNAGTLVAYRQTNPDKLTSITWVREALGQEAAALQAGPYITTQSYQFTADVAAVGQYGRGYRRTRFVFDTSSGTPKILWRQDLSHLGWALGRDVRQQLQLAQTKR